jgi:Tol biopolymer transport system component
MSVPPTDDSPDRLDSWKQIAAHLGKSERTVRRWQQTEGLPVHKHPHQQRGSVWAYRNELDQWLDKRCLRPEPSAEPSEQASETKLGSNRHPAAIAIIGAMIVLGAAVLWHAFPRGIPKLPEPIPLTSFPGVEYGPSVSPDGSRVAFFCFRPPTGKQGIYLKTLGSERLTPLVTGEEGRRFVYNPAWSPDGKWIAFLRREQGITTLSVIPAFGGPERVVARLIAEGPILAADNMHLAWSSDGRWIFAPALNRDRLSIHRVSVDTGEMTRLTDGEGLDFAPTLSPDGRTLAFLRRSRSSADRTEEILLQHLTSDGLESGNSITVKKARMAVSGLAWTGSDELVACWADTFHYARFNTQLLRLPARAGASETPLGLGNCSTPFVSPKQTEGGRVMVLSVTGPPRANLWMAQLSNGADGVKAGQLLPLAPSSRFDVAPDVSPDGKLVAYLSNRGGSLEAWISSLDGVDIRRVGGEGKIRSGPQWSPDGSQLVYSANGQLYTLSSKGGPATRIHGAAPAFYPSWSRNGQWLYFFDDDGIWRISSRGGERSRVAGTGSVPVQKSASSMPALESHDKKFLFYGYFQNDFTVFKVPLDGGSAEIVQRGVSAGSFALSKKYLYFMLGDRNLYRAPVVGGPSENLGSLRESPASPPQSIGIGIAVSHDDSKVVYSAYGQMESDLHMIPNFRW